MKTERKKFSAGRRCAKRSGGTFDVPLYARVTAYFITTVMSLACVLPFLLTVSVSLTDETALRMNGYSLIPSKIGLQGYSYVLKNSAQILRSYGVTIFVTVVGSLTGLLLMTLFAYSISRKYFAWRKQLTFIALFTMLFNGGMLPSYIVNSNILHLKDTVWALILPVCMNGMYVLILRTYMCTSIPDSVVESAKIDGAKEFTCYLKIVMPMAVPAVATIMLFVSVNYWNNWYLGFLYVVSNNDIMPIQLLLKRMENEVQFLANSAGQMGATELDSMKQGIPGETIRMCLVVIVVLPILVSYPFFQRFFVQGITVGAVKG